MGNILTLFGKSGSKEPEMALESGSKQPEMALEKAKELVSTNSVMVFSKTYCGYCTRVKKLLSQLGANYKVIELDTETDGDAVQSALLEWTGQRTVPNVFINGKHIGGCDNVTATHNEGKLLPLLTDAGAIASSAS